MTTETTTTLNPGAGGDALDERTVTQADGSTQAKRAVVAIAGHNGSDNVQPVASDPGESPMSLPTIGTALVSDLAESGYVDGQVRALSLTNEGRLRVASEAKRTMTPEDFFGDDNVWGGDFSFRKSPWD